jgi:hypothetical protein
MKRAAGLFVMTLYLLGGACVDPYAIPETSVEASLVVEAVISSQLKHHQIFLTRASSIQQQTIIRERGAEVWIIDGAGNRIDLTEEQPGIYETPEFAAKVGDVLTLKIKTASGKMYSSTSVPFKDGPEISDVYAQYSKGEGVQFYLDTEDPTGRTNFYRWNYIETYEVRAPFPSNWVWLGGNDVVFRDEPIGTCYVSDTLRNIVIRNTKTLDEDKISALPLRFIAEKTYLLRHKYSMLVQQFALSEQAFNYWNKLKISSEDQGSLSDQQPGSLPGNLVCESDANETVLGLFEVCKVSEKRIIISYLEFYDEGYLEPGSLRSGCKSIVPISAPELQLGEYMERYKDDQLIWEVNGFSPMAIFELLPIYCCTCADLGTTEKPDFF